MAEPIGAVYQAACEDFTHRARSLAPEKVQTKGLVETVKIKHLNLKRKWKPLCFGNCHNI